MSLTPEEHLKEADVLLAAAERDHDAHRPVSTAMRLERYQAAATHATMAQAKQAVLDTANTNICPHGGTGVCMHCLIPIVEHSLSQVKR